MASDWLSFEDAKALIDDEYSCVKLVTERLNITLKPCFITRLKSGVTEWLNNEIKQHLDKLGGVLLAYDNIYFVKSDAEFVSDSRFIRVEIQADFVVFAPEIGSILKGVVNKYGSNHVGCLVHNSFNASLPRPVDEGEWGGDYLGKYDSVIFEVTYISNSGKIISFKGKIVESGAENGDENGENCEEGNHNGDEGYEDPDLSKNEDGVVENDSGEGEENRNLVNDELETDVSERLAEEPKTKAKKKSGDGGKSERRKRDDENEDSPKKKNEKVKKKKKKKEKSVDDEIDKINLLVAPSSNKDREENLNLVNDDLDSDVSERLVEEPMIDTKKKSVDGGKGKKRKRDGENEDSPKKKKQKVKKPKKEEKSVDDEIDKNNLSVAPSSNKDRVNGDDHVITDAKSSVKSKKDLKKVKSDKKNSDKKKKHRKSKKKVKDKDRKDKKTKKSKKSDKDKKKTKKLKVKHKE